MQIATGSNLRGFSAAYCDYLDRFLTFDSFDQYARSVWLLQ